MRLLLALTAMLAGCTASRPSPCSSASGRTLRVNGVAGANQVTGLSFSVADPSTRRKEGFELALKDARAKAEALASPSGRTVGDIVCISEEVGEDAYTRLASLGYMSKPILEPGSHDSTFSVSVTFDLR
jgi:uncharacterized protein YggE